MKIHTFFPTLRVDQFFILLLTFCSIIFSPFYIRAQTPSLPTVQTLPSLTTQLEIPIQKKHIQPVPWTSAQGIIIADEESKAILYEKNKDTKLFPASTTKMMTALVALDHYQLNDVITVQEEAFTQGQVVGLQVGEEITVENVLKALLIASANDAAFALANNHTEGYQGFIQAMNEKASSLYLDNTHFSSASGLDGENHFTTARDLSILAREFMKHQLLQDIVATSSSTISNVDESITHKLHTTNQLLGVVDGVQGIKTGYTLFAGECLITKVVRNGNTVHFVVLGSQDRFGETKLLIDWVFENFEWVSIRTEKYEELVKREEF